MFIPLSLYNLLCITTWAALVKISLYVSFNSSQGEEGDVPDLRFNWFHLSAKCRDSKTFDLDIVFAFAFVFAFVVAKMQHK